MRGRKPIPTEIKRARGNPGRRPLNDCEPQVKPGVPRCPANLDEAARREWRRISKLLARYGVLTEMDASALATYCQVWSRWQYAEEQLRKYGPVILSPQNKFPIQSPYLAIANRSIEQLQKMLVEFGMTPSSRCRIQATPESESGDLMEFIRSNPAVIRDRTQCD